MGDRFATKRPTSSLVAQKYELVRPVGRGGMGAVWEARHKTLGTRVAIKFIDDSFMEGAEARRRFYNEAKMAARIRSRHAIQIHDHGLTEDGVPYIVMELLEGEPLDRRLERRRSLSVEETSRILQQVCRGLQRAHDLGIVHRDLKPDNIFLVRPTDEEEEIAKVLDFGIAKFRFDGTTTGSSATQTGSVLGTPFYMAPEQARGLRDVDHRADLWSLGVIAFVCVTGQLPFDGESMADILVKICSGPLPIPSHFAGGIPESFDHWFLKAVERDVRHRFQTALELAQGLSMATGHSFRRSPSLGLDSATPPAIAAHDPSPAAGVNRTPANRTPANRTPANRTPVERTPIGGYDREPEGAGALISHGTQAPITATRPPPSTVSKGASWLTGLLALTLGLSAGSHFLARFQQSDARDENPAPLASSGLETPPSADGPPESGFAHPSPPTAASDTANRMKPGAPSDGKATVPTPLASTASQDGRLAAKAPALPLDSGPRPPPEGPTSIGARTAAGTWTGDGEGTPWEAESETKPVKPVPAKARKAAKRSNHGRPAKANPSANPAPSRGPNESPEGSPGTPSQDDVGTDLGRAMAVDAGAPIDNPTPASPLLPWPDGPAASAKATEADAGP